MRAALHLAAFVVLAAHPGCALVHERDTDATVADVGRCGVDDPPGGDIRECRATCDEWARRRAPPGTIGYGSCPDLGPPGAPLPCERAYVCPVHGPCSCGTGSACGMGEVCVRFPDDHFECVRGVGAP